MPKLNLRSDVRKIGLPFKNWPAFSISVFALIVSAGSAYFNIVRQEDNLSVVFPGPSVPFRSSADTFEVTFHNSDLIFINSGNRPVAIISVGIFFVAYAPKTPVTCDEAWGHTPEFFPLIYPVVIKEKDVVVEKINSVAAYYNPTNTEKTGPNTFKFPVAEEIRNKDNIELTICLSVRLATPSVAEHLAIVMIKKYSSRPGGVYFDGESPYLEQRKPNVLIKKSETIFGR